MGLNILTLKFIGLWLYNAVLAPIPSILDNTLSNDKPPVFLYYFLFFALWLPEIALLSKSWRKWLKSGIEDGDGVLNKADLKDLMPYWGSYMSIKSVVLITWTMIFFKINVPYSFFVTLVLAGFGVGAIPIINKLNFKQ